MKLMMNMLVILYLLNVGSGIGMWSGQSLAGQKESLKTGEAKRILVQGVFTQELGVREKSGRNDGERVEGYLKQVGLKRGEPWCAAFICWVFNRAGVPNPNTAWAPRLFPREKVIWERSRIVYRKGIYAKESCSLLPRPGDVFALWFPEKKRIAHAGFVDSWSDSWLITVEGNTNIAGGREGDGVYRKRRLVQSIYRVANWIGDEGNE